MKKAICLKYDYLPLALLLPDEFAGAKLEVIATAAIPRAVFVAFRLMLSGVPEMPLGFRAKALRSFCLSRSLSAAFLLSAQAEWKMKLENGKTTFDILSARQTLLAFWKWILPEAKSFKRKAKNKVRQLILLHFWGTHSFVAKEASSRKYPTKALPIEDDQYGQRYPVISNDERRVEDRIFEKLDHTFSWWQITESYEMLPTENAGEKDGGRDYPGKDNHTKDLKRKIAIITFST